MPREPKTRVKLMDMGEGRGQSVPLSRSQLRDAGLDPDAELEANRYVLNTDRRSGTIRLRIYPAEDSNS
jgi:hypothetical protein